ncbi:hypothetical protein AXG93_3102s1140 [Marchantia polymorpha subsp. ruderalis]|uniref:Uncharacterized protein n=1 Tax=Marchantia polymorpha subsp. ruderalis TaxID=1480154 RepID=A0A176W856_MARPO|nr:hypothetical protein AXG93_3102s1140 [Marchantia polymorpha subsp. ruderalis]
MEPQHPPLLVQQNGRFRLAFEQLVRPVLTRVHIPLLTPRPPASEEPRGERMELATLPSKLGSWVGEIPRSMTNDGLGVSKKSSDGEHVATTNRPRFPRGERRIGVVRWLIDRRRISEVEEGDDESSAKVRMMSCMFGGYGFINNSVLNSWRLAKLGLAESENMAVMSESGFLGSTNALASGFSFMLLSARKAQRYLAAKAD